MTVEVLGTVVGTAIQGQIVGRAIAPCVPTEYDVLDNGNSSQTGSEVNMSHISLDETVRLGVLCSIKDDTKYNIKLVYIMQVF